MVPSGGGEQGPDGCSRPTRHRVVLKCISRVGIFDVVLPNVIEVKAPPLKTQGIKTRLASTIASCIQWPGNGRWVEPFVGSGAVALNLAPPRALLADKNPHVINLLKDIRDARITPSSIRQYLTAQGKLLRERGEAHYYDVRNTFNSDPSSASFVFLNRASFNGIVRFNRKGKFNTPFCRKPERFAQAYVTKISNQVAWAARVMHGKNYELTCEVWSGTLEKVTADDFVYADPPYTGRHADFYGCWEDSEALTLLERLRSLPCGYALSMWHSNRYRRNSIIDAVDPSRELIVLIDHHYHVGSKVEYRNDMQEMLIIRKGWHTELASERTPVLQEVLFRAEDATAIDKTLE